MGAFAHGDDGLRGLSGFFTEPTPGILLNAVIRCLRDINPLNINHFRPGSGHGTSYARWWPRRVAGRRGFYAPVDDKAGNDNNDVNTS
jgi:hypothetical protein